METSYSTVKLVSFANLTTYKLNMKVVPKTIIMIMCMDMSNI